MNPDDLSRRDLLVLAGAGMSGAAAGAMIKGEVQMERVTGIGGFFFRAKDPKGLAKWYAENLGVTLTPGNYHDTPWTQEAGTTVFEPFKWDTTYFGRPEQQWMINFRVANLDRMMAQLKGAGIAVDMEGEDAIGRFARLVDPEGNPIQLWEPAP